MSIAWREIYLNWQEKTHFHLCRMKNCKEILTLMSSLLKMSQCQQTKAKSYVPRRKERLRQEKGRHCSTVLQLKQKQTRLFFFNKVKYRHVNLILMICREDRIIYRGPSFLVVLWFGSSPAPPPPIFHPFPSANCLSFLVFLCVWGRWRALSRILRPQESLDSSIKKAWQSINCSILSEDIPSTWKIRTWVLLSLYIFVLLANWIIDDESG